jgi:hypothetical protein
VPSGSALDATRGCDERRNECVGVSHRREMVAVDDVHVGVRDGVSERELTAGRHKLVSHVDEHRGRDVDLADPTVRSVPAERGGRVEDVSHVEATELIGEAGQ